MKQQLVLVIAGGESEIVPALCARSGASAVVLEAATPGSFEELEAYVGAKLEDACSEATARKLAVAAWQRAATCSGEQGTRNAVGVALSFTLKGEQDPPNNSPQDAYAVIHSTTQTLSATLKLSGSAEGTVFEHQALAEQIADVLLQLISKFGVSLPTDLFPNSNDSLALSSKPQVKNLQQVAAPFACRDLIEGRCRAIVSDPRKGFESANWQPLASSHTASHQLIFPGSFNPPHEGHRQMAIHAQRLLGKQPICELAVTNAEKPPLDYLSMRERIDWLAELRFPVVITRAARFYEKAELFPGAIFIVGADTAVRIADPKFYDNQTTMRDEALNHFARHGCRFLVFGRLAADGFLAAENLNLPPIMKQISQCVPECHFRNDISSTQLRHT